MASVGMLHRTINYDHTNKMFFNGNAIADELPNIQLNLITIWELCLAARCSDLFYLFVANYR